MSETINVIGQDVSGDAWERHKRIIELRDAVEMCFLELGEHLYRFKEQEQYDVLGHSTFESYIADPDVDLSRSAVYALIGNYERYILQLECPAAGLLDAGWTKLDLIRSHVTEDNVEEWVDKARSLSRSDLRKELRDDGVENAGAESESWRFVLRGEFDTLNEYIRQERANKYAANDMKQTNQAQAELQIQWGRDPLQRPVTISFDWYRLDRRTDPDNISFAKKFIIDALVSKGVLENDGWKQVRAFGGETFHTSDDPRVEVRLE